MLSLEDCIAFSGLTVEQLDAVACHQHLPLIVVAEWAETVLDAEDGFARVAAILAEEVEAAIIHHKDRLDGWSQGLDQFLRDHAIH
ncbi:hypothetical protein CCC_04183 [Paramagnetospirillum magnetotacticum MS-1]|uniref:Uncharacterized protein n=1 Tax=Paramagnetospirillum magnetotacticum MS-1 TaxID=272627 RepID=A0A0C2UD29_PARME|nr:hypothetical protein [Paramagnetospirillum magnetotacticum]KIL99412.1 hypothetical protein CCC_04183 [Paramagnetospirillum magnetotacticum MS-1]